MILATRFSLVLLAVVLACGAQQSLAQVQAAQPALDPFAPAAEEAKEEKADEGAEAAEPVPVINRPKKDVDPKAIWLHTVEGGNINGVLSVDSITVDTEFGELKIPIERIVSFRPGLDNRPSQREAIVKLVLELGDSEAKVREAAQQELSAMGPKIRVILEAYSDDEDTERRTRVQKILSDFQELAEDLEFESNGDSADPLIDQDTVETELFTVVGDISPKSFGIATKFGSLEVALSDIRLVRRETGEVPDIHRQIAVTGSNLVQFDYKNSGISVQAGDKIDISASGKLVMSPWGNNSVSTPDGSANYQWYVPNKIPGGALIAKIGSSGKEIMVGSKKSFTADRPGKIYFGIAMNHQYANRNYHFPGEYKIKVHVDPN